MNDAFELPSLEEIEEMERQRSQAIESLEISDGFVKCQSCGIAVPMLRITTKPKSNRIIVLERQIKWIEEHYQYPHRPYGNSNKDNNNNVKQLKQELAGLLEEDAKADKLRSLPYIAAELLLDGNSYVQSVMIRSTHIHAIAKTKSEIQKSL